MKFIFSFEEKDATGRFIEKVGLELATTKAILENMEDNSTLELNPKDFGLSEMVTEEAMQEINETYGHVMTITKDSDGYTIWFNEEFFCDVMDVYGDGVVEVIKGISGIFTTLKFLVKSKVQPLLSKWKLC